MSDLIERQAAIDAVKTYLGDYEISRTVQCRLRLLPSAQPERKKGKWIRKHNIYGVVYCSECDYELHTNNTNFCPNCGAKMGEEGESK